MPDGIRIRGLTRVTSTVLPTAATTMSTPVIGRNATPDLTAL